MYSEDKVRPRALLIWSCSPDSSVLDRSIQVVQSLIQGLNSLESFIWDSFTIGIVTEFYYGWVRYAFLRDKVANLFIVDLHHTYLDSLITDYGSSILERLEQHVSSRVIEPWPVLITHHGMSLARASLAIGHYTHVETVQTRGH